MTREMAAVILESEANYLYRDNKPYNRQAFDIAIKALEQGDILDKLKAEVGKYYADCSLTVEEEHCKKCTDTAFKSILEMIDKYRGV